MNEKTKNLLTHFLLIAYALSSSYIMLYRFIVRESIDISGAKKITYANPVLDILGGNIYSFYSALIDLSFFLFIVFLAVSLVIYYASGRKRVSSLLFLLMISFAMVLLRFVHIFIEFPILKFMGGSELYIRTITPYNIMHAILELVALFWIIKALMPPIKTTNTPYPTHFIRISHLWGDRVLYFLFISNFFISIYIYRDTRQFDSTTSFFLAVLLAEFDLFVFFFVLEYFFQASPMKVLTGTRVMGIDEQNNLSQPTLGQILGRSAARLMPFDWFSFTFSRDFHDSLSHTTVAYCHEASFLRRQNNVARLIFGGLLGLFVWIGISACMSFYTNAWYAYLLFPHTLFFVLMPFVIVLATAWLSTLFVYMQSFIYEDAIEDRSIFWQLLLWWIPFLHFFFPTSNTKNLEASFKDEDTNLPFDAERTSQVMLAWRNLAKNFIVFYSLMLLGILAAYLLWPAPIGHIMMGFSGVVFCFNTFSFINQMDKFAVSIENLEQK